MLTTIASGRVYEFSHCLGMYSTSGVGFLVPQDFALGPDGTVYVLNRGVDDLTLRVSKCTLDHQFLGEFGHYGGGDGQFIWPTSIALDRRGNVYVADDNLHRITVFDPDGRFRSRWGRPGSGEGQLRGPSGIAFDAEDNLYVVEGQNHRVQKFTRDGEFLAGWGRPGSGPGEFDRPWGICLDRQGQVYVADWKNDRVQRFSPEGRFLGQYGETPGGVGRLRRPTGVAVDTDGDVYVADWGNHQLKIYQPDGKFITALVGDAQNPSPWAQEYIDANPDIARARRRANLEVEWRFNRPVAVQVDQEGRIYVAEAVRHRIQVYRKERDYVAPALNL